MSSTTATATVGGIPAVAVDVPISAVFIVIFITLAASHMTLFQRNQKRNHKFIFNAMLFGFCMSRIVACVMRIVWAVYPTNTNVAIATQVFINAGILLIYVINNLFLQRIIRSAIPKLGWNAWFRGAYKAVLFLLIPMLIMLIVAVIQLFKTADANTKRIDRDLQLAGLTYMTVIAVLPLILLPITFLWSRRNPQIDHFGSGAWHAKVGLLFATTAVSCTEAGFRAGTAWHAPVLAIHPEWFDSKAAFYCFNFMIDVILVTLFLIGRFDQRFHVPNGSNGSYGARREELVAAESKDGAETTDTSILEKQ